MGLMASASGRLTLASKRLTLTECGSESACMDRSI